MCEKEGFSTYFLPVLSCCHTLAKSLYEKFFLTDVFMKKGGAQAWGKNKNSTSDKQATTNRIFITHLLRIRRDFCVHAHCRNIHIYVYILWTSKFEDLIWTLGIVYCVAVSPLWCYTYRLINIFLHIYILMKWSTNHDAVNCRSPFVPAAVRMVDRILVERTFSDSIRDQQRHLSRIVAVNWKSSFCSRLIFSILVSSMKKIK